MLLQVLVGGGFSGGSLNPFSFGGAGAGVGGFSFGATPSAAAPTSAVKLRPFLKI